MAADAFKNNLLKADIYKTSSGAIRINLYTSKPYADSIAVNALNDNQYVILLPETSNSITQKPSIEKFADDIKDINIKTQIYMNNFKGYTKITISTNKPILITPQVLVLNPAAAKKNEETVQGAKNNIQKAPAASKTAQKSPKQTSNTTQKAQAKPVLKTTENKQKTTSKNISAAKTAPKNIQSKPISKPQKTAAQKPLNKTKQIAKTAPIKTTKPKPVAAKKVQPQPVKPAAKPIAASVPKNNPIQAGAPTPVQKSIPMPAPAPTPAPTAAPPAPLAAAPAPAPIQQPQPLPQPQPPVMPPANNGPANFLNLYTIGGTALGILFFLLLVARLRRNKVSQRARSNPTDYMDNIDNTNTQEFDSQNTNDLLDSGGSLFSVAQENLSEQEPSWDSQTESEVFNSEFQSDFQNGLNDTNDSEFEEFSQQPYFEETPHEAFSQQASESFEEAQEDETPNYLNTEDVQQEVDELLASEDLSEDFMPEYVQQAFSEENSGQNPQFDAPQEQYSSAPPFEQNDDAEFESLENDYQQNFAPEPEIDIEEVIEQERPRTIPAIPRIPTVPTEDPVLQTDNFGGNDMDTSTFAEPAQNINEQEFIQVEEGMSLDELNELESQNLTETEEPSIEELFAEDEKAFEEPLLTEEDLEEKIEIEEEIKIVEPLNQKFDESQIEKIKMPEKFEEVKTVSLPEKEIIEEVNFEQPPVQEKKENGDLQSFENFQTVAQPEEVVRSEFEIDDLRGFYMVDYLDFSILVGHVGEEIFILKKFEEKIEDKLQVRLNETKGSISSYMIKVGRFKALVEVNPQNMKLLIEL